MFTPAVLALTLAAAAPLQVTSDLRVERRVGAADGTTRIVLAAAARVVPGDRVVFTLRYRNAGARPIADIVLADPIPTGIAYRGTTGGGPEPELSVDGRRFAALADLRVALPAGGSRAAQPSDIVALRWRLAQPLVPGASGAVAFVGAVK